MANQVYGTIPKELNMSIIKNSSKALFKYNHPFDGHGYINKFTFKDSTLTHSGSYVKTKSFVEESKANKRLYRSLGTNLNTRPFDLKINNFSNISVFKHDKKLYSLFEGGMPYEIDHNTLDTKNSFNFTDILIPNSVHPKVEDGVVYNFACFNSFIVLYKINDKPHILKTIFFPFQNYYAHDFLMTKKYFVFYLNPISIDTLNSIVLGNKSILDSITFQKKAKIMLVNRKSMCVNYYDVPKEIDYPSLHLVTAKDTHTGVTFSCCTIKDSDFSIQNVQEPYEFSNCFVYKFSLNIKRNHVHHELLSYGDMPKQKDGFIYTIRQNELFCKTDQELITHKFNCVIEEPTVYEDYVIVIGHATNNTLVYVFDRHLNIESITELDETISYGFHGTYIDN